MQNNIIKRLEDYIEYEALTNKSDFAARAGIDPSGFSKMLKGKQTITTATLKKIADTYGISYNWLTKGIGDMQNSKQLSPLSQQEDETRPRIPMNVAAGTLNGFTNSISLYECEQIPVIKALPDYDYTMLVKGDSMEPKFEGGDEIAIRKVIDVIEWGKTYVLDTRDGAILKRLYDAGNNYRCVSYNKDYPDFEIEKLDVFGVYKVVGLIRI